MSHDMLPPELISLEKKSQRIIDEDEMERQRGGPDDQSPRYRRSNRAVTALAVFGGVSAAAIIGVVSANVWSNHGKDSDSARNAAEPLCDTADVLADAIAEDACEVSFLSVVPLKPRNEQMADGIVGAIKFVLDTDPKLGRLPYGRAGAGLYVHVDALATNSYQDTFNATALPDVQVNDNIGAADYFSSYKEVIAGGGDNGAFALDQCRKEMNGLLAVVKEKPEEFTSGEFGVASIADSINSVNYAPYSVLPIPEIAHTEIIFTATVIDTAGVQSERELKCPTPTQ